MFKQQSGQESHWYRDGHSSWGRMKAGSWRMWKVPLAGCRRFSWKVWSWLRRTHRFRGFRRSWGNEVKSVLRCQPLDSANMKLFHVHLMELQSRWKWLTIFMKLQKPIVCFVEMTSNQKCLWLLPEEQRQNLHKVWWFFTDALSWNQKNQKTGSKLLAFWYSTVNRATCLTHNWQQALSVYD